jgi:hypothetical protein
VASYQVIVGRCTSTSSEVFFEPTSAGAGFSMPTWPHASFTAIELDLAGLWVPSR